MATIAGRNIFYTCSILRASIHAGRRFIHGQNQQYDVHERRSQMQGTKSRPGSENGAASLSLEHSKRQPDYRTRYAEYLEACRHVDQQRQHFDKFAKLVELIPPVVEADVGHRSELQVNTMGNNNVRTFARVAPSSDYDLINERLLPMLQYHQRFVWTLQGALIDAPVHLRLRKHLLGLSTNHKSILASTNDLRHLSTLKSTLYVDADAFSVAILDHRCRSKWAEIMGAVTSTSMHLMDFLNNAPKSRFTSILRNRAFANHDFYSDLYDHRQEYRAFLARRSDVTDAVAIYIAFHQILQDIKHCHSTLRKLEKWTIKNSREKRVAAATIKALRYTWDAYKVGFIALFGELSASWMPSLLQFLKRLPAHELERKRRILSRYWLRRVQHQKAYEAAMIPINKELEHSKMMKGYLRRKRENGGKPRRQGYRDFDVRRTGGALLGGGSTTNTSPIAHMQLSRTLQHISPQPLTTSSGRRYSTATSRKRLSKDDFSYAWQDTRKTQVLRVKLSRGKSAWKNCIQHLKIDAEAESTLPLFAQRVYQYQQEYDNAMVACQSLVEMRLQNARKNLKLMQQVQPIGRHIASMKCLAGILRAAPFHRLQTFHWIFTYSAKMIREDLKIYERLTKVSRYDHRVVRQFDGLVLRPDCVSRLSENTHDLWEIVERTIYYPSGPYELKLKVAFATFQVRAKTCSACTRAAVQSLAAINLRGAPSSALQRAFFTSHYRYRDINSSRSGFHELFLRTIKKLAASGGDYSSAVRRLYDTIVHVHMTINTTWISIMNAYHDDYLFISIRRLELMTPEELQRRSNGAQDYWVKFWQTTSEHERRMSKIEQFRSNARKQRNKLRSKMRHLANKMRLGIRVDPTNERADQVTKPKPAGYKKHKKGKIQHQNETSGNGMT